MRTRLVNTAARVILAAQQQRQTAAGVAIALDAAQLLQDPQTAREHADLRARVAGLEAELVAARSTVDRVRAAVDDLTSEVDKDIVWDAVETPAAPDMRCSLHGSSCDGDMEQAHIMQPATAAVSCTAEFGGPGYTRCELTAGHVGGHEAPLGNLSRATWGREPDDDGDVKLLDPRSFDRPGQRAAARMLNADTDGGVR